MNTGIIITLIFILAIITFIFTLLLIKYKKNQFDFKEMQTGKSKETDTNAGDTITEGFIKDENKIGIENHLTDQFVVNLSHEIRTPLNSILGMTELALATSLTREQQEFLETVKNSANALLYVIDDIRDYWKIETGALKLEKEEFNIRDSLEETINLVASRASYKNIEFAYHVSEEIPELLIGDAKRFKQILLNIYTHLLKFINEDDLVLRIERKNKSEILLHLTLADTVLGSQKEKVHAILNPLINHDSAPTPSYSISGIGLTMAYNLIKLMDGEIWLDDESTKSKADNKYHDLIHFLIKFGLPEQNRDKYGKKYLSQLSGSSILIIEQNQQYINSLVDIVHNLKMESKVIGNIKEALFELEQLQHHNQLPSLILLATDFNIKDVTRFIKDMKGKNIPIILITNDSNQKKELQSKKISIHSVVAKPLKPTELTYEIFSALSQTNQKAETAKLKYEYQNRSQNSHYKILVADDNLVDRKLLVRLMEKSGHEVDTVESGNEVIAATKNKKYDLILMDLQMPEMDGIETTQKIRLEEKAKKDHIAIIAITAHAMQEDRERCIASGMDGYISKPIKVNELMETIDKVFYHQTVLK